MSCNSWWAQIWDHTFVSFYVGRGVPNLLCIAQPTNVRLVACRSNCCRVEVSYGGEWGTVCDDAWDNTDARVVCSQMGGSGGRAVQMFGGGSGKIWMDNVHCSGSETSITACRQNGWGNHNCAHAEDAGVCCTGISSHTGSSGTGWLTQIGCASYSESDVVARLHQIDVGLRAFIKEARVQAERKAELYKEAFVAESQARGEIAKEQVQRKYAAEISQALDAKAYADGKIQEYRRIKAQLERHLKSAGVCKYQDIDPVSGKKMRMLAQVPHQATSYRPGASKSFQDKTSALAAVSTKCSYLGVGGGDYRGLVDHTGDGFKCLPWPKGWALKYHGSGMLCVCCC